VMFHTKPGGHHETESAQARATPHEQKGSFLLDQIICGLIRNQRNKPIYIQPSAQFATDCSFHGKTLELELLLNYPMHCSVLFLDFCD